MTRGHYLLDALASLDDAQPLARKLLVAPTLTFGRDLLAAFAVRRGQWVGWEATTLGLLAERLAFVPMAQAACRRLDDVAARLLVGDAFDAVGAAGGLAPPLEPLRGDAGTRRALADAVLTLRAAGADAARLRRSPHDVTRTLGAVLAAYEQRLANGPHADAAQVLRDALAAFETEAPFVFGGATLALVGAMPVYGLRRDFVDTLLTSDAPDDVVVLAPPVASVPVPASHVSARAQSIGDASRARVLTSNRTPSLSFELVEAGSATDEVRGALRTALREGRPWDDLECVTLDQDVHGVALESLASRLAIGATSLDGVPLGRTRLGRAVAHWFAWLRGDLAPEAVRVALECGDLGVPQGPVPTPDAWDVAAPGTAFSASPSASPSAATHGSSDAPTGVMHDPTFDSMFDPTIDAALDPDAPTGVRLARAWRALRPARGVEALRRAGAYASRLALDAEARGRFVARQLAREFAQSAGDAAPEAPVYAEEFAVRDAAVREDMGALARLLFALFTRTLVPVRRDLTHPDGSTAWRPVSLAGAAQPLLTWLAFVPTRAATVPAPDDVDDDARDAMLAGEAATRQRIVSRLTAVRDAESTLAGPVGPAGATRSLPEALAELSAQLADVRAWTDVARTSSPRRPSGGHVHLTSVEHAGTSGRARRFVFGLDADATGGPTVANALLGDAVLACVPEGAIATPATRRADQAWLLASLAVIDDVPTTYSFASGTTADGRTRGPSPVLLALHRARSGEAHAGYDALRRALQTRWGPIPAPTDALLDTRDAWLAAIGAGPVLADAEPALREAGGAFARWLALRDAWESDAVGAAHGLVPAAAAEDPRASGRVTSPTSLETLAACPRRWFYRTVLAVRPPRDVVYDADVWLDALERGSVLHAIYKSLVADGIVAIDDDDARGARVRALVDEAAADCARRVPSPSVHVQQRETEALHDEALYFVQLERDLRASEPDVVTVGLERSVPGAPEDDGAGLDHGGPPPPRERAHLLLALDEGAPLPIAGQVDRIDRAADGLRVVDYKTGRTFELKASRGPLDGGRKLQLPLYAAMLEGATGEAVVATEYRFPTRRGEGARIHLAADAASDARTIVRSLLDDVAAGRFLPTDDGSDCRFCDYRAVCRVTDVDEFTRVSPRAEWAKALPADEDAVAAMRARRAKGTGA